MTCNHTAFVCYCTSADAFCQNHLIPTSTQKSSGLKFSAIKKEFLAVITRNLEKALRR